VVPIPGLMGGKVAQREKENSYTLKKITTKRETSNNFTLLHGVTE
jgi:hypothetical protein